ncbi:MAG: holo-ACP synthase [Kofleriaceae bacterium]
MARVLGVGIDLVEMTEFRSVLRASVAQLVFSAQELAACKGRHRIPRLAARFAAKEAVFKAIGTGWADGMSLRDVEVVAAASGAPRLVLRGETRRCVRAMGGRLHLSLSHAGDYATAVVVHAR